MEVQKAQAKRYLKEVSQKFSRQENTWDTCAQMG